MSASLNTTDRPWPDAPPAVTLGPDETHVFAIGLEAPRSRAETLLSTLTPDEQARARRYRSPADRRRYVVARAGLRAVLARVLDASSARSAFSYGRYGKPSLASDGNDVRFNLSRTTDVALVAIQAHDDVGVDVERVRGLSDAVGIARRFFAPAEHAALRAAPASERAERFFDLWTRKEAVVKSVGTGLAHPLDAFGLAPRGRADGERVSVAIRGTTHERLVRTLPAPRDGVLAALATAGASRAVRCWSLRT